MDAGAGTLCVCGLDLRGETVWYSATSDGVTCGDDRRSGECCVVGGFGDGGAENLSREGEGTGGGGLAEDAGSGSAAICGGDAGAASGAAMVSARALGRA